MKAILIIDDIQEEWFENNLSAKYELLYYPNGEMKELGIHGKSHLKQLPQKKKEYEEQISRDDDFYEKGWNDCLKEILGEEK